MAKNVFKKKKGNKGKQLSQEALQIAEKEKRKAGEKKRYTHLDVEFQRITEREKKA